MKLTKWPKSDRQLLAARSAEQTFVHSPSDGSSTIIDHGRHCQAMTLHRFLIFASIGFIGSCSPFAQSTQCKGLSKPEAVRLALEQKRGMLSRSFRGEQDNFASNSAEVFEDTTGYVAKVGFRGKDGRTLIALIDEDCYVGWTKSDR